MDIIYFSQSRKQYRERQREGFTALRFPSRQETITGVRLAGSSSGACTFHHGVGSSRPSKGRQAKSLTSRLVRKISPAASVTHGVYGQDGKLRNWWDVRKMWDVPNLHYCKCVRVCVRVCACTRMRSHAHTCTPPLPLGNSRQNRGCVK